MRSWWQCCRILVTARLFSTILTCARTIRLRMRREKPVCSTWTILLISRVVFPPPSSNPNQHLNFADYRLPTVNLILSLRLDQGTTTTSFFTVSLPLCFVSNIAFSSSYLEETSIRISDLRSTWKTKRQIFRNCFTLVFVCKLLFAHSLFTSFFSLQKTTFFLANSDVIGFLWNRKIIFYLRENISVVKIYSSTVVLRRCFDDATRHPGPKKEKKLSHSRRLNTSSCSLKLFKITLNSIVPET